MEAPGESCQMLGLDPVGRIFNANAMNVEIGSLIRRWRSLVVH
jgi:hypothetical protein